MSRARAGALALWLAGAAASGVGGAAAAAAEPAYFLYHAEPRDTLIGLGRRLLLEPRRWHDLKTLNRIADPRRIPSGAVLKIPYDWLRVSGETATVVGVGGAVTQAGRQLTVGDVLAQGSVVETGTDGSVTLDLEDGSVVTLQKSSVLRLDEMVHISGVSAANSIRLKLDAGRIETRVKPHGDVGRFEIVTPVAVSAVRGTEFRDSFGGAEPQAITETLEGTVGVSGAAAAGGPDQVAVAAGFGTRVARDQPPLPPVALLPPPDLGALPDTNATPVLEVPLPPVPGAARYRVQLSARGDFQALRADLLSDGVARIEALPDGLYWLRARAIDRFGIEGTDAVRQIRQHLLPPAPRTERPAEAARVSASPVELAWSGAAARYALQVAPSGDFREPVVDRLTDAPTASLDLAPGRYYWRVAAVNAQGEAGAWSVVRSYTLRPPPPPPDVAPPEGKRVSFSWPAVPGSGYRIEVARGADFAHPLAAQRLDAPAWSMPLRWPGTYYARVQVVEADGSAGDFSAPRRFVVPVPLWLKLGVPLAIGLAFSL